MEKRKYETRLSRFDVTLDGVRWTAPPAQRLVSLEPGAYGCIECEEADKRRVRLWGRVELVDRESGEVVR